MKKTTLMFFLTLGFLQTQAQDYLIGFAAPMGIFKTSGLCESCAKNK